MVLRDNRTGARIRLCLCDINALNHLWLCMNSGSLIWLSIQEHDKPGCMGSHAAALASECHLSQERAAVIHNHLSP